MEATTTTATTAAAPIVSEPKSEKLTNIRSEIAEKLASLDGVTDITAKLSVIGEIGKLQQSEAAEIAEIKKAELQLKLAEANAKRVSEANAIIDGLLSASETAKAAAADKKMSIDDKNSANAAYVSEREKLVNLLIGKSPKAAVSSEANIGKTAAAGANDGEIQAAYLALVEAGSSEADAKKALEAEPHNFKRSTIWFAIDRLKNPAKYAK